MRRVLIVAFQFPPFAGSSGVQRVLRFVQHLPKFGWEPIVLTANRCAYEHTSGELLPEIPADLVIERAFALDAKRHLSVRGRYPAFLARPDRWMTWQFDAIRRGVQLCRTLSPQAIWSTYPIATAHVVGGSIHAKTGIPWIADFRDPMVQDGYPADSKTWCNFRDIEEKTLRRSTRSVFVTEGAAHTYRARYSDLAEDRFAVIENGYDEESFATIEGTIQSIIPLNPGKLTILHSGVVYPSERDPTQLFLALRELRERNVISAANTCIRFRASSHDDMLRDLASANSLNGLIEILPSIPYHDAIVEMMRADALLLMQASNCNQQIPAKFYEYLRAKRPIVGLTDPVGDTGQAIAGVGIDAVASLESKDAIASLLATILPGLRQGIACLPDSRKVKNASRYARTNQLALLLDYITKP